MRLAFIGLAILATAATVGAAPLPAHPRIFITRDEIPRLRTMATDTRRNALGYVPADDWKTLQATADRFLAAGPYHYAVTIPGEEGAPGTHWEYTLGKNPPPRHDDSSFYPPWTAMFQERDDSITTRIKYLLLAYEVTGNAKYFDRVKEIVLDLCAWPEIWTDPSFNGGKPCLDTGHAATWVGIFYDWCHDALTPAERETVRKALCDKALAPIDGMIDNIPPYHNYTAVIASGLAIGAIAVLGEEPRAQGWLDHAIARIKLNFDAQGKDGGAMEGPGYGTYATDRIADMIWALRTRNESETTAGIPNQLVEHPYIKTMPRYCISLLNPNNNQQPCFGDGGPTVGFVDLMTVLALRGDSDAAWYCQQVGALTADTPRHFLALDPAKIHPRQPDFDPSGCFVDIGYAILRDGYSRDGAFLAFKSGPPDKVIGHNHYDHNSFVINYAGEWIAWDPGYRNYFEPRERRYTTSTFGHNSIVLDLDDAYLKNTAVTVPGHDQQQLDKGRIKEFFTSDRFDYVLGDAAATYNTDKLHVLDRFDRQIVLVKPSLFFIRDSLAAPQEHTYSFMLHLPPGDQFTLQDDHAEGVGVQCLLQIFPFAPGGIKLAAASYPGAENRGPYLAATTAKAKTIGITTVIVPRRHEMTLANPGFEDGMTGWTPRTMPGFTENHVIDKAVKHSGEASARIDNGGYYYSRHFTLPPGTKVTVKFWAKCTAATGATSTLYFWRQGKAFAHVDGPAAKVNEWKQYELSAVVPEGTEDICLALQFFGKGQCWYDDVTIDANHKVPDSTPAVVTPINGGADGAVAAVDGVTTVFLCGATGAPRTITAAGHTWTTDANIACVRLGTTPLAFLIHGNRIDMDGKPVPQVKGDWRVK